MKRKKVMIKRKLKKGANNAISHRKRVTFQGDEEKEEK